MSEPLKFPPWLLALDVVGTVILGLGLFGQFGGDNLFSPFAIPLIIIGALLQISSAEKVIMWIAIATAGITAVNIAGGFAVTRRMLDMFRK